MPAKTLFEWRGTRWSASSIKGRFQIDNSPERRTELHQREHLFSVFVDAVRERELGPTPPTMEEAIRTGFYPESELHRTGAISPLEARDKAIQRLVQRAERFVQQESVFRKQPADILIAGRNIYLIVAAAILPAIWFRAAIGERFRARRASRWGKLNRCLSCGYSLKGNVSGICPECGEADRKRDVRRVRLSARG